MAMLSAGRARAPFLLLSLCLVGLAAAPVAAQRIVYVDDSNAPGGDGTSWARAYARLGRALAAARPEDRIWIAAGTYPGGFVVPDRVTLIGGFEAGATRVEQARPRDNITALWGRGGERVLVLGDATRIVGLVVRGGRAGGVGGGGVLVEGGDRATIERCEFTDNGNTAGRGSTILVRTGGHVTVRDSLLHGDAGPGHLIDVDGGSGVFERLTIDGNKDNGIHCQRGADVRVQDCIFSFNSGRGICDIALGPPNRMSVVGNLFYRNRAPYHDRGRDLTVAQLDALPYASQNLAGDPRYVDRQHGRYAVLFLSPAVDSGTLTAVGIGLDGYPRPLDGDRDGRTGHDRGAFESPPMTLRLQGLPPARGRSFSVVTSGLIGPPAALVFAARLGPPVMIEPLGPVLVTAPAIAVPIGGVGRILSIPVPASTPPGTVFAFQGVMVARGFGSVTGGHEYLLR